MMDLPTIDCRCGECGARYSAPARIKLPGKRRLYYSGAGGALGYVDASASPAWRALRRILKEDGVLFEGMDSRVEATDEVLDDITESLFLGLADTACDGQRFTSLPFPQCPNCLGRSGACSPGQTPIDVTVEAIDHWHFMSLDGLDRIALVRRGLSLLRGARSGQAANLSGLIPVFATRRRKRRAVERAEILPQDSGPAGASGKGNSIEALPDLGITLSKDEIEPAPRTASRGTRSPTSTESDSAGFSCFGDDGGSNVVELRRGHAARRRSERSPSSAESWFAMGEVATAAATGVAQSVFSVSDIAAAGPARRTVSDESFANFDEEPAAPAPAPRKTRVQSLRERLRRFRLTRKRGGRAANPVRRGKSLLMVFVISLLVIGVMVTLAFVYSLGQRSALPGPVASTPAAAPAAAPHKVDHVVAPARPAAAASVAAPTVHAAPTQAPAAPLIVDGHLMITGHYDTQGVDRLVQAISTAPADTTATVSALDIPMADALELHRAALGHISVADVSGTCGWPCLIVASAAATRVLDDGSHFELAPRRPLDPATGLPLPWPVVILRGRGVAEQLLGQIDADDGTLKSSGASDALSVNRQDAIADGLVSGIRFQGSILTWDHFVEAKTDDLQQQLMRQPWYHMLTADDSVASKLHSTLAVSVGSGLSDAAVIGGITALVVESIQEDARLVGPKTLHGYIAYQSQLLQSLVDSPLACRAVLAPRSPALAPDLAGLPASANALLSLDLQSLQGADHHVAKGDKALGSGLYNILAQRYGKTQVSRFSDPVQRAGLPAATACAIGTSLYAALAAQSPSTAKKAFLGGGGLTRY